MLFGIEKADRAHFETALRTNFDTLFPSADATPEDLVTGISTVMYADPVLSKYLIEA